MNYDNFYKKKINLYSILLFKFFLLLCINTHKKKKKKYKILLNKYFFEI